MSIPQGASLSFILSTPVLYAADLIMAEFKKNKKLKQQKLNDGSESEEEDLEFVVQDSDDGSKAEEDELDRAEGKRKRDGGGDDSDSSDSDSDSDSSGDEDDINHEMSKDEVAALERDQGNIVPRAKRRAAIASGIGDASALEAIKDQKPDSDDEAEFEF